MICDKYSITEDSTVDINDITNDDLVKLPDNDGLVKFKKIMKHPLTPEEAQAYILPIFDTPNLKTLLKSLNRDDHLCDVRPHVVDYLKVEYPQFAERFINLDMLRDDNIEGTLSPLGHKDEESE